VPRLLLALPLVLLVATVPVAGASAETHPATALPRSAAEAHVKAQLAGVDERIDLMRMPDGELRFVLHARDGMRLALTPDQFAARVLAEQTRLSGWERLLNITSPWGAAWVGLGLLGQLLFTGRMLLQWLASERRGASVVPTAFWWLSLAGATMLLVYFVWRRDVVGVIGQATGWVVYGRNLWLIHHGGVAAEGEEITGGAAG
jgi:lipid-A-disaccharide synthase-like uncharacterized protein